MSDSWTASAEEADVPQAEAADERQSALLAAENRRLREAYAATRRQSYRRTALGLLGISLIALSGALVLPSARTVLFALAGTGAFGAVLTYYLTPERFVASVVSDRIFESSAENAEAIVAELGLSAERIYVPSAGVEPARLYVPQRPGHPLPDPDELRGVFVATAEQRGLALLPTGATLFREFERVLTGEVADTPSRLGDQIADALVEDFEIASAVHVDVTHSETTESDDSVDELQITVGIEDSAFDPTRMDTPAASFVGVTLAVGLDTPMSLDTTVDEESQLVVQCTPSR